MTESQLDERGSPSAVLNAKPAVSVIVPCYNYGDYLRACISSIQTQTFQDLEIIIVDDGSTDPGTGQVVDSLELEGIRVIRQDNQGVIAARNNGIAAAYGELICCLDADDTIEPTFIEKCVAVLKSSPFSDIAYSWVNVTKGDENFVWRTENLNPATILNGNHVPTCTVMRKNAWKAVKGYNPAMHDGYEDWEFWANLAKNGFHGTVIPEPLFNYISKEDSRDAGAREKHAQLQGLIRSIHSELTNANFLNRLKGTLTDRPYGIFHHDGVSDRDESTDRGPHILLMVPWLVIGGSETILFDILSGLKRDYKMSFSIMTTETPAESMGNRTKDFSAITESIYHLPNFLHYAYWNAFMANHIETQGVDGIFIAGSCYTYSRLDTLRERFPNLWVVDQVYNEMKNAIQQHHLASGKYLDATVVAYSRLRDVLVDELKSKSRSVTSVLCGVDAVDTFAPDKVEKEVIEGVPPGNAVVGFNGRFSPEKGALDFVRIAQRYSRDDVSFVMTGDGPERGAIENVIEESGLQDRVILRGFIPDLAPFLKACDLLVMPSLTEGIPIVMLEAMALETPVLASRVGGIPQVIEDKVNGLLGKPGNIHSFASKINFYPANREKMQEMGKAARQTVLEQFETKNMVRSYNDIFHRIHSERKASHAELV